MADIRRMDAQQLAGLSDQELIVFVVAPEIDWSVDTACGL
jgi:hypothetical protein